MNAFTFGGFWSPPAPYQLSLSGTPNSFSPSFSRFQAHSLLLCPLNGRTVFPLSLCWTLWEQDGGWLLQLMLPLPPSQGGHPHCVRSTSHTHPFHQGERSGISLSLSLFPHQNRTLCDTVLHWKIWQVLKRSSEGILLWQIPQKRFRLPSSPLCKRKVNFVLDLDQNWYRIWKTSGFEVGAQGGINSNL